ncbi:phosphate-starvation-inducible PsiE family protein [Psychromonas sp. MME2]|uniref:phosphate-starvation-inducible protein PsiE n=1 Tax=Psychromonas sp. MME2 TaxID=3231033 RepID=UPI00339C0438
MGKLKSSSYKFLLVAEYIGLTVIAIATIVAMCFEITSMFLAMQVTLADLLLLFIYLEVFAMVGIYLKSGKLPVRMPLYIAIVAIARYIILDMKNLDTARLLALVGAVLVFALSILIIRYGHVKYPYHNEENS